jgi:hypothetical protein
MFVLWVVTPCAPVGRYQLFGGTYRHHLQPWRPTTRTTHELKMAVFWLLRCVVW